MAASPALTACRAFMAAVWESAPPSEPELIAVLESLLAFTDSHVGPQTDHWKHEPPEVDWKTTYAATGKRFPNLGLYELADPKYPTIVEGVGDAIDDIADITQHTRDMIWYAEHHSIEFAEDYFAMFHFHWSSHAEDLLMRLRRGTDLLKE